MVEKGLKVGAIFEDGEQTYKVLEVLPDGNYISKALTEEETQKKRTVKDSGDN